MTTAETREEMHQEEDTLPAFFIVLALVGTLVIAVVLCLIAWGLLGSWEKEIRPDGRFPEMALGRPARVASMRQGLFGVQKTGERKIEAQRRLLDHYGWVDQKRGLIHVPIERAIELELAEGAR